MMQIRINGREESVPDGIGLEKLLESMNMDRRYLVVEHNGEPVAREALDQIVLSEGDRLELVRPVAGG